jgi:sulfur-carrier protein
MSVTVRLFATLRDVTGTGDLTRPLAGPVAVERVWEDLVAEWPSLAAHRAGISCAVNAEYAKFTDTVRAGDEVAFLPPVSGG